MCLVLFAWNPGSINRLIVAANRDEFYQRPTKSAHFWGDDKRLLAGKDLEQDGAWLGVTRDGRFAAVTNFRSRDGDQYPRSRGQLTTDFLQGSDTPEAYLVQLEEVQEQYAGFNLLVGDTTSLFYYSNRSEKPPLRLEPGIYGLSNHLLNTEWPKVNVGVKGLREAIEQASDNEPDEYDEIADIELALLGLLQNDNQAEDKALPDTGVGIILEKMLSPLFIKSPGYGTRASSVVRMTKDRGIMFLEQNYDVGGVHTDRVKYRWIIGTPK